MPCRLLPALLSPADHGAQREATSPPATHNARPRHHSHSLRDHGTPPERTPMVVRRPTSLPRRSSAWRPSLPPRASWRFRLLPPASAASRQASRTIRVTPRDTETLRSVPRAARAAGRLRLAACAPQKQALQGSWDVSVAAPPALLLVLTLVSNNCALALRSNAELFWKSKVASDANSYEKHGETTQFCGGGGGGTC